MKAGPESGWIVDASVALKWFLPPAIETDSDLARNLIGNTGLRTTSLAFFEVGNRLVRSGDLTPEDVATALQFMDEICGPAVEFTHEDFRTCASIAKEHRLTFYDASYVAVARRLNRKVVSADTHLLKPGLAEDLKSIA